MKIALGRMIIFNWRNWTKAGGLIAGLCLSTYVSAAVPRVVVSIAPLHSLVSAVMLDVATPSLLITGGQSPHSSHLRPSAIRQLSNADLLVWVGPHFELTLTKFAQQARSLRQLSLAESPQIRILKARDSGVWAHHADSQHEIHDTDKTGLDFHLWLATDNARAIVEETARVLSEIDAEHAQQYRNNAQQVIEKIRHTKRTFERDLKPLNGFPYMVFHDAYHYFENEFGLNPVGAVTLSPERKPGIQSVLAIKQTIAERGVRCIFHEPQFAPRLTTRIAKETGIHTAELDPIGANLEPGPTLWFELMQNLHDDLLACAASKSDSMGKG